MGWAYLCVWLVPPTKSKETKTRRLLILTKRTSLDGPRTDLPQANTSSNNQSKICAQNPHSDDGHPYRKSIKTPGYLVKPKKKILVPFPADRMKAWPISSRVNVQKATTPKSSCRSRLKRQKAFLGRVFPHEAKIGGVQETALLDRFEVGSAGTRPWHVRPEAIAVMKELGIDISDHRSKHVQEFENQSFDCVLTVCDNAKEGCPVFPGHSNRIHKGFISRATVQFSRQF